MEGPVVTNSAERSEKFDRYERQVVYPAFGEQGQEGLDSGHALICGSGALGSVQAAMLVRAGVGRIRIVDRDVIELVNLQRQILFTEEDVKARSPKAEVAAKRLRLANSEVEIEPIVANIDHTNIESFCTDVDVVLDGTDNFETRFLINDVSFKHKIPWIYGGCLGAEGQTMTILPGETACFRCLIPESPLKGKTSENLTAGIFGPAVGIIASLQAMEAIKILSGHSEAISRMLTVVDLWQSSIRQFDVSKLRDRIDCPTCRHGRLEWLEEATS